MNGILRGLMLLVLVISPLMAGDWPGSVFGWGLVVGAIPGLVLALFLFLLWWRARWTPPVDASKPFPSTTLRGDTSPAATKRKQEANERTTEVLIRQGLPAARLGGWEHDLTSNRLTWSEHIHEIFGRTAATMPTTFDELLATVHPDDRAGLLQQAKRLVETGIASGSELRITWPDGSIHWQATRGELVRDADGRPLRVVGIAMDITDRHLAEQQLRDSEERYRTVISAMHDGVVIYRADGQVIDCNASAGRILGLTREQLLGQSSLDPAWRTIHEDGSPFPGTEHPNMVAQRTGQPQHGVIIGVHCPDGRLRWLSVNADPLRPVRAGASVAAVATFRDITDHLQHENALRDSEHRLRSIAENNPNTISMIDRTGTILYLNRTVAGVEIAQILGTNIRDYLDDENKPAYLACLERVFADGCAGEVESRIRMPQSEPLWFLNSMGPLRTGGRIIAAVITAIDITGRHREQEERQRYVAERANLLDRLQMHIARMPVAYFVFDEDFRIREVNPAAEHMFGFSAMEMLGLDPRALIVPSDSHHLVEGLWARLKSGDLSASSVNDNLTKDGRRITCEWINTPLFEGDRFIGAMSMVQDISQRLLAERAMRESEERWRSLAENVPDTILLVDRVGTVLFINRQQGDQKPEEVLGLHISAVMPAEFSLLLSSAIDRVFTGNEVVSGDIEINSAKQSRRWYSCHISPVRLHGRTIAATLRASDITERRQAENERRQFQNERETMFERMPIGCILWSRERRISYANPAAEQIFGFAPDGMNGFGPELITFEESMPEVAAYFERIEKGDMGLVAEMTNRKADGGEVHCEWHPTPLFSTTGELTGIITMVMDISERALLEEQLRQSQKMEAVGRLAGGIAHDFNNLLTAIMGYGELLESRIPLNDQSAGYVQQIKKAAKRAASLTYQLLAFSRKQVLQTRLLVVGEVITDLEPMLRRLIGEHIVLKIDLAPAPWKVLADAGQLEQVVVNLVVNARDAMPSGGALALTTRNCHLDQEMVRAYAEVPPGDYVMLVVSDNGDGMEDKVKKRIFEPFFTTKPEGKGTGLGLAVVFGVVRQSGGFIFVDSVPTKGSRFEILLPRADSAPEPFLPRDSTAKLVVRGSETILLVEDDQDVRGLVKDTLESSGYTVFAAANGQEAMEISAHHPHTIDLLLTDVVMPGLGGREVADRVRQQRPAIKVLFMSGYTDDLVLTHGVADGTAAFIEKPFSAPKLLGRIRKVLSGEV